MPGDPTGASSFSDYVERSERLVTLWVDLDWGILVWAPFGALAFFALELLVRSLRERLHVALPSVVDVEVTAGFLVALCAAQVAVAAFLSPVFEDAGGFPGRELLPVLPVAAALCAWALRHTPRIGGALGALTLVASAWLLVGARAGDARARPAVGPAAVGRRGGRGRRAGHGDRRSSCSSATSGASASWARRRGASGRSSPPRRPRAPTRDPARSASAPSS